jgi:hypothetical protein
MIENEIGAVGGLQNEKRSMKKKENSERLSATWSAPRRHERGLEFLSRQVGENKQEEILKSPHCHATQLVPLSPRSIIPLRTATRRSIT